MYVRLAFSVAAHFEPEVLILDEVLAVGDAEFQQKCFDRMVEIRRRGATIIMVSHDLLSVKRFCDRAFLFDEGRLVDSGTPDEVVDRYLRIVQDLQLTHAEDSPNGQA